MTLETVLTWLKQTVSVTANLTLDSRDIQKGDVFVACVGVQNNGAKFIEQAFKQGAQAVLLEENAYLALTPQEQENLLGKTILKVSNLRELLGGIGHYWYGEPSAQLSVIAITGTNGKTSCAAWIAQSLNAENVPCATIGTLGVCLPNGQNLGGHLTTPDALTLHKTLRHLANMGMRAVAIEASSIGIEQGRLAHLQIEVAAFTNLSLDHLDYHHTMQAYEAAKTALFTWPSLKNAVINVDDEAGLRMYKASQAQCTCGYSLAGSSQAQILAQNHHFNDYGLSFVLTAPDGQAQVLSRLVGEHNISNLLLVAGVLHALGWSVGKIAGVLAQLKSVDGRLQQVAPIQTVANQPLVVVDYAHTPDALERALIALRPNANARQGQLHCVFGCGGNRDSSKRPIMGRIAYELSDRIYITSDNPRNEDPHAIVHEVLEGIQANLSDKVWVDTDRAYAILTAILRAESNDMVLIAGKGHETYQEVNGVRRNFDDRQWAQLALLLRQALPISTDTRTLKVGDLFVALKGEQFDAHQFLEQVQEKGAVAAVVSSLNSNLKLPQILVADTERALALMGKAWRQCFDIPVMAVTGSNGKTTTKEMIASVLHEHCGQDHCLATAGNFNNHIGVPLSLLKLRDHHRMAVFELGMNHPNEIAYLADLTRPTVALVNNAQREHQEFMHTVEAVAKENAQVFDYLTEQGQAIYPADDPFTSLWDALTQDHPHQRFAVEHPTDVWASDIEQTATGMRFTAHTRTQTQPIELAVQGQHNVRNALAAMACCLAAGIPLKKISIGLKHFKAVKGRLQTHHLAHNVVVIDDTYNANPDSVIAAINVLAQQPSPRLLVLGDMGEVGQAGVQMHYEVGQYAKDKGIDYLACLGVLTQETVKAFGENAQLFSSMQELQAWLVTHPVQSYLIKGSRYMKMERAVQTLLNPQGESGHAV